MPKSGPPAALSRIIHYFKEHGDKFATVGGLEKFNLPISTTFFWRQLMYFVLFKSVRKAIKGELNTWGTLKRTGGVKEVTMSE